MVDYHTLSAEDLTSHIQSDLEEVQTLYAPLLLEQLRWRPSAARWSVGQCLHHLVVTDRLYLDRLGVSLELARQRGLLDDGPDRLHEGGRFGHWFTAQVGPRVRLRIKAPRSIAPDESPAIPGDVAEAFIGNGRGLLTLIKDARGLDLHRARIGWPLAPFVRLRVIDALRAMVAHDRRHLNQARGVTQEPGFPESR